VIIKKNPKMKKKKDQIQIKKEIKKKCEAELKNKIKNKAPF